MGKDLGAVAFDVFVELDANSASRAAGAAGPFAHLELKQVERKQERLPVVRSPLQAVEISDAGVIADHNLALDRGVGRQCLPGSDDQRVTRNLG